MKQVDKSHVWRLHIESRLKVGQLKVMTKIYQTIESLMILFIKLQFYNQVCLAFSLLRISILNFILNLSLNLTGLLFIIRVFNDLDLTYTNRNLYISNQVKFRPMYLLSGLSITSLYPEAFVI